MNVYDDIAVIYINDIATQNNLRVHQPLFADDIAAWPSANVPLRLRSQYKELRLYLRVTDDSGGKVFRTVPIGQLLSLSRPQAQVDKHSNLRAIDWSGLYRHLQCRAEYRRQRAIYVGQG